MSDDGSAAAVDPPDPARVVADADVLAADLLIGGAARDALDCVRRHSWMELVATSPLLADAEAVVAGLADGGLAADWREKVEKECVLVEQERGDHPALAAAHRGAAAHLLSFNEGLGSAKAGAALREYVDTSVKRPRAFARLFDPGALYPAVEDGKYPGSDRDPRA